MMRKTINRLEFEGMFVDILDFITKEANMTYEIQAETEVRYGYEHSPGNWTGLIGVLQDENSVSYFSAVIPLGRWGLCLIYHETF